MRIAVLICGQFRALHKVYQRLNQIIDKADFFLSIDHNINDYNILKECPRIKRIVYQNESFDNDYRNVLNYTKKIVLGCEILPSHYDCYIIIRSDLIIDDDLFLEKIQDPDAIYVFDYNHNPFLIDRQDKLNGNCIITRNYKYIEMLTHLDIFLRNGLDYFDVILYKFLRGCCNDIKTLNISSHLLLFVCRIIAISGDSASGKTTLCECLHQLFDKDQILKLETDRYHKWERGNPNYDTYTHLHPDANYLQKMEDDVYNLVLGDKVVSVDYDHITGNFTPLETIKAKENILLCGLHTLWSSSLRSFLNLKIFMDTDRDLIYQWKMNRDVSSRRKTKEIVQKEMERRYQDYLCFIESQREEADLIIRFYDVLSLKCRCIFKKFSSDLLYIIQTCNYSHHIIDHQLEIDLFGDSSILKEWMIHADILKKDAIPKIQNDFYGEIQLFIYFISS